MVEGALAGSAETRMYIHIGLPKTGTTSLRDFFRRNNEVLRRRGVVYPDTTRSNLGNATPAATALLGEAAYFAASHPKYASKDLDFEECWRELTDAARPGKALLVSSEEFSFVPPAKLFHATASDGFEKRILVYLRRQDRALEAKYQQKVRNNQFLGTIEQYVHDAIVDRNPERGCFYYREFVTDLWNVFGRDRVHVIPYKEGRPPRWLFATALEALGLSFDSAYELPPRRNPSLHPLFVEYLRRRSLAGGYPDDLVRLLFNLANAQETLTAGIPSGILSSSLRERVRSEFEEENTWLAAEIDAVSSAEMFGMDSGPSHFVAAQHEGRLDELDKAVTSASLQAPA